MTQIYSKEPINILAEIFRDLYINKGIAIYKEIMNEEPEDTPDSYILLRSQVNDNTNNYGNGVSQIRAADCDIMLISKGYAEDTTDLHNKNKEYIRELLREKGIPYREYNLGYIDSIKSTQQTFSITVLYYG